MVRTRSGVRRRCTVGCSLDPDHVRGGWQAVVRIQNSDARYDPCGGSGLDRNGSGRVRSMLEMCWMSVRRSGVWPGSGVAARM
jgi:hypothetical protein